MRIDIGGGVRIFVDVVGPGLAAGDEVMQERPTLIALHGGPGFDHSTLRPWFDRFADTHQVVYVDHRGNGRSDGHQEPADWTLDTWADDVARLCAALEVQTATLLGVSFGALVAIHAAARHPALVDRVVVISANVAKDLPAMLEVFERRGGTEARTAAERYWSSPDADTQAGYVEHCFPLYTVGDVIAGGPPGRATMNREVMRHYIAASASMDLSESAAAISCPALVLVGEDDPVTPVACAERIAHLIPGGRAVLKSFADCGHGTYRDQPELTEAAIRQFLVPSTVTELT